MGAPVTKDTRHLRTTLPPTSHGSQNGIILVFNSKALNLDDLFTIGNDYTETCVREPPLRKTLNSEGWCGKVAVF